MRRPSLSLLVLIVTLSGCSKHSTDSTAPPTAPPVPELVGTHPAARSTSALYDTDIWAQFDRPLDPRTVTALNVYLKLDGQRVPITVSYDTTTQRVSLTPTVVLELQRTYTVEFSTAVKGTDGAPLAPGVFFQFTTNSLRRPSYDFPLATSPEGPVATLGWGGAQGPSGNIVYELYASTDSNAVIARTAPMLARSVFTRFVPSVAWPMGSTIYWSLTSENQTTHERLAGSLASFHTMDASAPLDSVTIPGRDHGSKSTSSSQQGCNNQSFSTGGAFNGAIHWDVGQIPGDARLQSVSLKLNIWVNDTSTVQGSQPALWLAQNDWVPCSMNSPGPPYNELTGLLATATTENSKTAVFSSDRLAGLLEAQLRQRGLLYGTLIRASHAVSFHSTLSGDVGNRPSAVVRFYRAPTVPSP
jgi:hypothetical protein